MPRVRWGIRCFAVLVSLLAAGLCTSGYAAGPPAQQGPVAVVTDVDGKASICRSGHAHALAVLEALDRSDQLRLEAHARVEIAFTAGQGRVFSLSGPGRFALRADDVVGLDAGSRIVMRDLAGAWRALRIRPGAVGRASVSLRGVPGALFVLRSPVGAQLGNSVDELQWEQPFGLRSERWDYAVRVIDSQGSIIFSTRTHDTSVPLPRQRPWLREQTYLWTVEAIADDGRHTEAAAEFRIVDPGTEERIRALGRIVEQARSDAPGSSAIAEEVLLAMALEQAGLRNEADPKWRALAQARPAFGSLVLNRP